MARSRKRDEPAAGSRWASLTWDDLESWAGDRSVSRGRAYQRQGRVHDLSLSSDGRLLATVQGGETYATSVWLEPDRDGGLQSRCSCPVGVNGCKHAVAVVAEYLRRLADREEVRPAGPDDPRWADLAEAGIGDEEEEGVFATLAGGGWDEKIYRHLAAKSRAELLDLIVALVRRFPELHDEFKERIMLGEGDADRLMAQARRELQALTAEPGWRNSRDGEGYTPDYSRLKHRLERLVELGHHDAVTELGRDIIACGLEQVGQSQDEGETAMAFGECLPIVFDAVARSRLSSAQKLLFAIDALLQDDYDVIGDDADAVLDAGHAPADWSDVADELARRIGSTGRPEGDDFSRNYTRDRIAGWLVRALEKAGRDDEILPLYEREARLTSSYERLVRLLIERKQFADAERWALEGIEKTRDRWPGIASALAAVMGEMARRRGQWDVVAAHAAHRFFERPSAEAFGELAAAAGATGIRAHRDQVRQAALRFLETGEAPVRVTTSAKQGRRVTVDPDWPLPVPDCLVLLMRPDDATRTRPHYGVLLDMAIAEKRTDDILHWYGRMESDRRGTSAGWEWYAAPSYADRVAEAVASSQPQQALDIYRRQLDARLQEAQYSAYEACAAYLRKMRPIMASLGREGEWKQLLADIRLRHRNRPRFMEILDRLDGGTILQSRPARGKRR